MSRHSSVWSTSAKLSSRKNVSRAWTNETSVMCGVKLDENLPYND